MPIQENLQIRIQKEVTELSQSIGGLVDSFRKLRNPLVESREKVPQATDQLDKISEQTEAAAHQMLDMVEQILRREEEIVKRAKEIKEQPQLDSHIATLVDGITEDANTNLNDAFMIMESLQFQDITAQQMDHAASLLEDIETKLHNILSTFGEKDMNDTPRTSKTRAYDPHADMFEKRTDQKDIDSLFEQTNKP